MDQVGAGMRAEKKKAGVRMLLNGSQRVRRFDARRFLALKQNTTKKKAKNSLVGKSALLIYITIQHMDRLSHWQFSPFLLITR